MMNRLFKRGMVIALAAAMTTSEGIHAMAAQKETQEETVTTSCLLYTSMNYLLLYLEENYGLTREKKVQSAIKIVANENRYHPVRDYLNLSLIHIW